MVEEFYTSKTCTKCGVRNHQLGGKEFNYCESCEYCGDRDIAAARNILIRFLSIYYEDFIKSTNCGVISNNMTSTSEFDTTMSARTVINVVNDERS